MRPHLCPKCKQPLSFSVETVHCEFCGYHKNLDISLEADRYLLHIVKTYQLNQYSLESCKQKLLELLSKRYKKGDTIYLKGQKYIVTGYLLHTLRIVVKDTRKNKKNKFYAIPLKDLDSAKVSRFDIKPYEYKFKNYL